MIFGYETFMYIFKNNCKEKVLRALYGTTKGPILVPIIMTVIISTFLLYAFAGVNVVVAIILLLSNSIALKIIYFMLCSIDVYICF